jgi:hypothetical protein
MRSKAEVGESNTSLLIRGRPMVMALQADRRPLAAHLIPRKFWFLGLILWACWVLACFDPSGPI